MTPSQFFVPYQPASSLTGSRPRDGYPWPLRKGPYRTKKLGIYTEGRSNSMRTNLHQARVITTREMQFHNQNNRLNENKVDPHGLTAKPLKKKPLLRFAGSSPNTARPTASPVCRCAGVPVITQNPVRRTIIVIRHDANVSISEDHLRRSGIIAYASTVSLLSVRPV